MQDRLVWRGLICCLGGVRAEFSEGSSGEGDAVCMMHQSIQNRVAKRGITDAFVPVFDRHLTGQECGAPAGAIFDHL